MKTILKYPIQITEKVQYILLPQDYTILCIQVQAGTICLWAEVETENEEEALKIVIRGTGWPFKGNEKEYLGTVQVELYVWHIYHSQ